MMVATPTSAEITQLPSKAPMMPSSDAQKHRSGFCPPPHRVFTLFDGGSVHNHKPLARCPLGSSEQRQIYEVTVVSEKSLKPGSRRPVGQQAATPFRLRKASRSRTPSPPMTADLLLPHERDESTNTTAVEPDPVIKQAKRDIDAGLVDTDMRATPGLDAERRRELVPGPGGKPPTTKR